MNELVVSEYLLQRISQVASTRENKSKKSLFPAVLCYALLKCYAQIEMK